jgi:hypothetical protein
VREGQVTQASDKAGGSVNARMSAAPAVGTSEVEAGEAAPSQSWRGWTVDRREEDATRRARHIAVVLMALSSVLTVALLAAAWVLLRNIF